MAKESAGILLFRRGASGLEVLLAHPGGPLWENKDLGAWSIPKGLVEPGEDRLATATREFAEEIGFSPAGTLLDLGSVKQKSGKIVFGWAVEGAFDPANLKSNFFEMEWPPRSGKMQSFPEIDRAEWFPLAAARAKMIEAQTAFLDRLQAKAGQ